MAHEDEWENHEALTLCEVTRKIVLIAVLRYSLSSILSHHRDCRSQSLGLLPGKKQYKFYTSP